MDINNLTDIFNKFLPFIKEETEADLIYHMMGPFLNELGYQWNWVRREPKADSRSKKRVDIEIRDEVNNFLIIEVKKNRKKLDYDDVNQLLTYMNPRDLEWGILTNGTEWALINNKIKGTNQRIGLSEKVVFYINFEVVETIKNFIYFTYESLFITSISNYYRDLQQFKVAKFNGSLGSWRQYEATLNRLIRFLREKFPNAYTQFQGTQLILFIDWISNQKTHKNSPGMLYSTAYLKATYRHLRSFFNVLVETGNYPYHPIKEMTEDNFLHSVQKYTKVIEDKKFEDLNEIIISVLALHNREDLRNKLILLLLFYGIKREDLANIQNKSFDQDKGILSIKGTYWYKSILLPSYIKKLIIQYLTEKRERKIKSKFLFCQSNGKPLKAVSITYIANELLKKVSSLNIESIQQYFFEKTVFDTKNIFSIWYLRDIKVKMLSESHWENIDNLADLEVYFQKHPLTKIISTQLTF